MSKTINVVCYAWTYSKSMVLWVCWAHQLLRVSRYYNMTNEMNALHLCIHIRRVKYPTRTKYHTTNFTSKMSDDKSLNNQFIILIMLVTAPQSILYIWFARPTKITTIHDDAHKVLCNMIVVDIFLYMKWTIIQQQRSCKAIW